MAATRATSPSAYPPGRNGLSGASPGAANLGPSRDGNLPAAVDSTSGHTPPPCAAVERSGRRWDTAQAMGAALPLAAPHAGNAAGGPAAVATDSDPQQSAHLSAPRDGGLAAESSPQDGLSIERSSVFAERAGTAPIGTSAVPAPATQTEAALAQIANLCDAWRSDDSPEGRVAAWVVLGWIREILESTPGGAGARPAEPGVRLPEEREPEEVYEERPR